MIAPFERFVVALREAGLSVSPAECIEGLRAAELVGVDDKARLRAALRTTLAKRARQQPLFDEVFERFFAAPGRGKGGRREASGEPSARSPRPGTERSSMDPRLRQMIQQARDGKPRRFGRLRHVVATPAPQSSVERAARERSLLRAEPQRREQRRMENDYEREIAEEVPRLVDQIRLRTSRRAKRSSRGRLYLRRAFRENLRHEGVPFVLPRRKRPRKRSRVVLLIDVSWSTARAAGLFLALSDSFLRRARDRRVLLFVDRPIDATAALAHSPRPPLARVVASLSGLDLAAPSDYGRAFYMLLRSPGRPHGRDTLLLVLGDGRTNRFDPQDWAFEELARGCGAVIWIVPEPAARWGTGDSALGAYLQHADVAVEAQDLPGLARGVAELVRRL